MPLKILLRIVFISILAVLMAACSGTAPEPTASPTESIAPTENSTQTATVTASHTPTPSKTPVPSATPSPTVSLTPTPDFVWGQIKVALASCRFGPGGGYLLRSTLFEGDDVEILGHMELNENWWFLHTTSRPDFICWVSKELVKLGGDITQIFPIDDPHLILPFTDRPYDPLKGVNASRNGNLVSVRWDSFEWLAGDQSLQDKYLVEVWICLNAEYVFRAYSTNASSIEFQDEQNCDTPSKGRAFGSDKHGYTVWVNIPWPQ